MEEDIGRCLNCGYLGKRDKDATASNCYEATIEERLMGELTKFTGMPIDYSPYERQIISTRPWCFINKAQFYQELSDIGAGEHNIIKVKEIISKDRKCPYWYEYKAGLNPKGHYEECKMQQLENDRREFERKLTQMQIDANAKVTKVGIWIGIAAIILAVAEVLTMNEDALLWKWIDSIVSLIRNGISQ